MSDVGLANRAVHEAMEQVIQENEDLRAQLAEDKARLDWLEGSCASLHCNFCDPAWTVTLTAEDGLDLPERARHGDSVRGAIDAARAEGKSDE